jgi:hypothetical protein
LCTCRKTSITEEPLPTTHNAEGWHSYTCREKPDIGTSLESTTVNVAVRGAVEAKAYAIFKMVYMEKNSLENNHVEDSMKKHHDENFKKYSYMKG